MNSGIYTITCLVNEKIYLGFAKNFTIREDKHFRMLKNDKHTNEHLQNAYNLYGKENFKFEILEYYPNEGFILPSMEHYWAGLLNVHNRYFGYNIKPTHPYGKNKQSTETRMKISKANKGKTSPKKGKPLEEQQILQMSLSRKGKKKSKETKEKMSEVAKNRKWTEETKEKMVISQKRRRLIEKQNNNENN
jgi:group I intron endonuclease